MVTSWKGVVTIVSTPESALQQSRSWWLLVIIVTIVRHDITVVISAREQTRIFRTVKLNRALLVEDHSRSWYAISRSWGSIPLFSEKKSICKKLIQNLHIQNLLDKYICSKHKLQFQRFQNQLKYIDFFQNIFTNIHFKFQYIFHL